MQVLTAVPDVLAFVVSFADEVPEDDDVKAGWLAFGVFIALIVAVALLGRSLVKQLRKAREAEDAGLYDPSERPAAPVLPVDPDPRQQATRDDD